MIKKERFGKYLILDHLADGGMATICRACLLDKQTPKIVIIKMVKKKFSKDPVFQKMFMDEIKTSFQVIHPNIVQTYDYGIQNQQLYIAMEYCEGYNLKDHLIKLQKINFICPVEISIYIISQIAQGLHYAHTLRDQLTNKYLNIIHRDISPQNIILTKDGTVKIIDFGISKSNNNTEMTSVDIIKGKISYIAPEYLHNIPLDARYDQFSLMIVFWEMLCNRKLFKASNDLSTLKKIEECKIPLPSTLNPHVIPELDRIILKGLSADREKRFQNLEQLNRSLIKFLYSHFPDFNAVDLSYFSNKLFKEEFVEDQKKILEYGKIDLTPHLKEIKTTYETSFIKKEKILDFGYEENDSSGLSSQIKTEQTLKTSSQNDFNTNLLNRKIISKNTLHHKKAQASQYIKESPRPRSSLSFFIITFITMTVIYQFFTDNTKKSIRNIAGYRTTSTNDLKRKKIIKEKNTATIQLNNIDHLLNVIFIDDRQIKVNFTGQILVPSQKKIKLRVEQANSIPFNIHLTLKPKEKKIIVIPAFKYMTYGYLNTSRNCIKGILFIKIFNKNHQFTLPLRRKTNIKLPIGDLDGTILDSKKYSFYYILEGENLKRNVQFELKRNVSIDLCRYQ